MPQERVVQWGMKMSVRHFLLCPNQCPIKARWLKVWVWSMGACIVYCTSWSAGPAMFDACLVGAIRYWNWHLWLYPNHFPLTCIIYVADTSYIQVESSFWLALMLWVSEFFWQIRTKKAYKLWDESILSALFFVNIHFFLNCKKQLLLINVSALSVELTQYNYQTDFFESLIR